MLHGNLAALCGTPPNPIPQATIICATVSAGGIGPAGNAEGKPPLWMHIILKRLSVYGVTDFWCKPFGVGANCAIYH